MSEKLSPVHGWSNGGMVDTRDLKSLGLYRLCGFDSRLDHKFKENMKLNKKQLKEIVTITCYNDTQKYTREDALYYFEEAIISVDPESSECERYQRIYEALLAGDTIISDE